jgi:hypothetical protein
MRANRASPTGGFKRTIRDMDEANSGAESRLYLASALVRLENVIRAETNRARHIQLTAIREDVMAAARNAHMGSQTDQLAG